MPLATYSTNHFTGDIAKVAADKFRQYYTGEPDAYQTASRQVFYFALMCGERCYRMHTKAEAALADASRRKMRCEPLTFRNGKYYLKNSDKTISVP